MIKGLISYLLFHLFSYILVFRKLKIFRKEMNIFLYHAVPFLAWVMILFFKATLDEALFILGAIVIYDISFLQVWTHVQGGYSMTMMIVYRNAQKSGNVPDQGQFTALG